MCVILPHLAVLSQTVRALLRRYLWIIWPLASRLSRSLKVIATDTNWSATNDFLLAFHSNHEPTLYRFRNKRQFQSKITMQGVKKWEWWATGSNTWMWRTHTCWQQRLRLRIASCGKNERSPQVSLLFHQHLMILLCYFYHTLACYACRTQYCFTTSASPSVQCLYYVSTNAYIAIFWHCSRIITVVFFEPHAITKFQVKAPQLGR